MHSLSSTLSAFSNLAQRTAAAFHRPTPSNRPRRGMLLGGLALAIALALPGQHAGAQNWSNERWTGTWGTAPAGPPPAANLQTFTDQTLRLIVHTSIGGNRVRIRVSNEFGSVPLRIGAARIGVPHYPRRRSLAGPCAPGAGGGGALAAGLSESPPDPRVWQSRPNLPISDGCAPSTQPLGVKVA